MSCDRKRILRCSLSSLVGMVCGVVQAEIVANSLIEVAATRAFAIVFAIAFVLLGLALLWRAWMARAERVKFALLGAFALLVVSSGIACFFVTNTLVTGLSAGGKTPLFMLLGISLSFALTFCFTELVNANLCARCCACFSSSDSTTTNTTGTHSDDDSSGIISSRKQLAVIFVAALLMGALYGILFGSLDVEMASPSHNRFETLLLASMPVGLIIGGIVGALNQWLRETNTVPDEARRFAQTSAADAAKYERL
jgi:hypothetical protein